MMRLVTERRFITLVVNMTVQTFDRTKLMVQSISCGLTHNHEPLEADAKPHSQEPAKKGRRSA